MALEEMFGTEVPEGMLFYGKTRRHQVVALDTELRALTERVAIETRALLEAGLPRLRCTNGRNATPVHCSSFANPSVWRGKLRSRDGLSVKSKALE
jgi:hypothetical protein